MQKQRDWLLYGSIALLAYSISRIQLYALAAHPATLMLFVLLFFAAMASRREIRLRF